MSSRPCRPPATLMCSTSMTWMPRLRWCSRCATSRTWRSGGGCKIVSFCRQVQFSWLCAASRTWRSGGGVNPTAAGQVQPSWACQGWRTQHQMGCRRGSMPLRCTTDPRSSHPSLQRQGGGHPDHPLCGGTPAGRRGVAHTQEWGGLCVCARLQPQVGGVRVPC